MDYKDILTGVAERLSSLRGERLSAGTKYRLMAAILTCGFLATSCEGVVSEADNPSAPSRQEIEKSLVGLHRNQKRIEFIG